MPPDAARGAYSGFVGLVRSMYEPGRVKDGVFGAMMKVALVNGAGACAPCLCVCVYVCVCVCCLPPLSPLSVLGAL